jgi:hypothetical protein
VDPRPFVYRGNPISDETLCTVHYNPFQTLDNSPASEELARMAMRLYGSSSQDGNAPVTSSISLDQMIMEGVASHKDKSKAPPDQSNGTSYVWLGWSGDGVSLGARSKRKVSELDSRRLILEDIIIRGYEHDTGLSQETEVQKSLSFLHRLETIELTPVIY